MNNAQSTLHREPLRIERLEERRNFNATWSNPLQFESFIISSDEISNHVVEPGHGYDGVVQLKEEGRPICTGSLLNSGRHVLTAAHCVDNEQIDEVVFDLPSGLVSRSVESAVPHEHWDTETKLNDIAIISLLAEAPHEADRYDIWRTQGEVGKIFTKVGYGLIGHGDTGYVAETDTRYAGENRYEVGFTSQLAFDFDNGTEAQNVLGRLGEDSDLGLGPSREANPSHGDSGGPSFVSGKIAGVTSGGRGFTDEQWTHDDGPTPDISPGNDSSFGEVSVDTRVSFFANWIDSKTAPSIIVNGIGTEIAFTNTRSIEVATKDFGRNVDKFQLKVSNDEPRVVEVIDGKLTAQLPNTEGNHDITLMAIYADGLTRSASTTVTYVRPHLSINAGSSLTNTGRIFTNLHQLAPNAIDYQLLVNGYVVQDWKSATSTNQDAVRLDLKSTNYLQGRVRYADGRIQTAYAKIKYGNAKLQLNGGNTITNTGVVTPTLSDLADDAEQIRFRINGGDFGDWMPVDDVNALPRLNYVGMNYVQAEVLFANQSARTLYAKIEYAKPSIVINNGTSVTDSRDISIKLLGVDSTVKSTRLAVNSWSFPTEGEAYQEEFELQLPNYRGKNYVNVQLEYADGRRIWLYIAIELT